MKDEIPFDMNDVDPIYFNPKYYDYEPSYTTLHNGTSHFHLRTSILTCETCGMYLSNEPLPLNNMNATLMIIGESPTDVQFETSNGEILATALKQVHVNFDDIYLTAARKSVETQRVCDHHLSSELIVVHPLMIIALGYEVGAAITDHVQAPGQGFTLSNGSDLLVTNSLSEILQSPSLYQPFINHLQIACNQWEIRKQQRSLSYERV
ncbi:uracil-DNA glycosylase family protein [Virgibacillus salexigens]|uniref:Uracil-DNA glycosylase family domain protein n=1 Tax=Virgibacillus massiliensis TaxID=1462526 RepID=A0A024QIX1_9BACI|nr:hypothetical protein [Virgibacillus massiliensis]CDQ41901.1 uracil-DNA glycosylase family domain protein [Virgibacillus massiliensis]